MDFRLSYSNDWAQNVSIQVYKYTKVILLEISMPLQIGWSQVFGKHMQKCMQHACMQQKRDLQF